MNLDEQRRAAIDHVVGIEGGYVDDPADSGGKTRYGITEDVAREFGYQGPMAKLPAETAHEIYRTGYWDKMRLDDIALPCPLLAAELFEAGVNCGPGAAASWLQIALNACNTEGSLYPDIAEDGDIGDETLGALRSLIKSATRDVDRLLASMCNILQGAHYIELSRERKKDERFVRGWIERRVMADFELISRTGNDSVDSDSSTGPR